MSNVIKTFIFNVETLKDVIIGYSFLCFFSSTLCLCLGINTKFHAFLRPLQQFLFMPNLIKPPPSLKKKSFLRNNSHKIHPFKAYNLVVFSMFRVVQLPHYLITEPSHHSKKNSYPSVVTFHYTFLHLLCPHPPPLPPPATTNLLLVQEESCNI